MGHWSIRVRLTLWYSLVLLAGLAAFGTGIWLVAQHGLMSSLDDALREQAKGVVTVLQSHRGETPAELQEELDEYVRATAGGNLMELHDHQGRKLISSKVAALQPDRYRTLTATAMVEGEPYRILVATPLEGTEATLRRVRTLFLWAAPVVLLMASLGGYWISRRALAPVDAITQAARSIGIQNLSQRLNVPATGDELQRLSETWNDMLARLESAVKRFSQFTADASHERRTAIALSRPTPRLTQRRGRAPE